MPNRSLFGIPISTSLIIFQWMVSRVLENHFMLSTRSKSIYFPITLCILKQYKWLTNTKGLSAKSDFCDSEALETNVSLDNNFIVLPLANTV